jgi:hypothetical protein
MIRVLLAVAAAMLAFTAAPAGAATPDWLAEGAGVITSADPAAVCTPDAQGFMFGCQIDAANTTDRWRLYNGRGLSGSCGGREGADWTCGFRSSAGASAPSGEKPHFDCQRSTSPQSGKTDAWYWSRYAPPKPAALATTATLAECLAKTTVPDDDTPKETSGALGFTHRGRNGLLLTGGAGSNGGLRLRRLTVTLPKDVRFDVRRTCTRAFARGMTLDNHERCTQVFAGRLNDTDQSAYFAYAGPSQRGTRKVWIRTRSGDELVGFATGTIRKGPRGYGEQLVLDFVPLGIESTAVELYSEHLRGPCRRSRYKLALVNDRGTLRTSAQATCTRGRGGGR